MTVKEIMTSNVITIKRNSTIEEIAHILTENNISGVPVVDDEGRVVGIVTGRDLLYKDLEPRFPAVLEILGGFVFLSGVREHNKELRKVTAIKAEDIMTSSVITVDGGASVEKAASIMAQKNINRVPVVDNGKLVGIVSRHDVVRYIAKTLD